MDWHDGYADPTSPHSQRLAAVQQLLASALDAAPPGPVRLVSMCAGQGHDVLGVLASHGRRGDVTARLVELDEGNAAAADAAIEAAGLAGVEVHRGDAASTDAYLGAVPAEIVLVCGVFGNISPDDIRRVIDHLPAFCAPRATVLWTRHRRPPDLTGPVRDWFARAGFEELAWVAPPDQHWGVGAARLVTTPAPLPAGEHLFTFTPTSG